MLLDLLAPDAPAYSVEDPRGSYVILPSARAGQTPAEETLVVDVADRDADHRRIETGNDRFQVLVLFLGHPVDALNLMAAAIRRTTD